MGKKSILPAPAENSLLAIFLSVLILFALTRIFIAGTGYFSVISILKYKWFGEPNGFLDLFFHWDSGWYRSIVQNGYSYVPDKQSNVVFYPLYPLLVKIVSTIFDHTKAVGFLISNLGLLTGSFYMYRIVYHETENHNISLLAVFLLLINPMSFFHSIFYAEGIFLGLTTASFYYALQNRLLLAGLLGLFATLTRMAGIFTAIPIILQACNITTTFRTLQIPKDFKKWVAIFLPSLGIIIFYTFLYIKFGDPLVSVKTQATWSRHFSFVDTFTSAFKFPTYFTILFFIFLIISLISFIHLLFIKTNLSYPFYLIFSILLPISSGLSESFPRYMSVVFPIYLSIALLIKNNQLKSYSYFMLFIGLLTLCTALFVNGYWMT